MAFRTVKFCFRCKYYAITVSEFCAQESSAINNSFKQNNFCEVFKQRTLYFMAYIVMVNVRKCKAGDIITYSNLWTKVILWQWTVYENENVILPSLNRQYTTGVKLGTGTVYDMCKEQLS